MYARIVNHRVVERTPHDPSVYPADWVLVPVVGNVSDGDYFWNGTFYPPDAELPAELLAIVGPKPVQTLPRAQFLDLLMDAMGEDAFFVLWDSTGFRRYRLKIELATVIDWSDAEPVADSLAAQGLITSNKLEAFKAAWPKA